jgi:Na+-translocating ferredoxin:NAD+ oxidoreductase RnfG subunit
MFTNRIRKYYPVFLLVMVVVLASAFMITTEEISRVALESQQDPATLALLQQIFPEADYYRYDKKTDIYTLYNNSRQEVGYAFYGESWGYRGTITVLVGLRDKETIENIVVISQNDDLSYWNKLKEQNFFSQFIELEVVECYPSYSWQPGGVDCVSGATFSSKGVINAVRDAILEKIQYLD